MSKTVNLKRILLKLSGEALMEDTNHNFSYSVIEKIVQDINTLNTSGIEIGIVIGGGNIFRGRTYPNKDTLDRVTGDHIGMLATIMNSLAMKDFLNYKGIESRVYSAFKLDKICYHFNLQQVLEYLKSGGIVLFAAGTGNPFFTTDTAASLRAIEIKADLLIKATKVDGIYSSDPVINPNAVLYSALDYDQVLKKNLGIMDLTAILLCRDYKLPLRVINIYQQGALKRIIDGEPIGTLVHE